MSNDWNEFVQDAHDNRRGHARFLPRANGDEIDALVKVIFGVDALTIDLHNPVAVIEARRGQAHRAWEAVVEHIALNYRLSPADEIAVEPEADLLRVDTFSNSNPADTQVRVTLQDGRVGVGKTRPEALQAARAVGTEGSTHAERVMKLATEHTERFLAAVAALPAD